DGRDPQEVLPCLQGLVEAYETLTEVHGLQKIKTIGDNYMAAAGLLAPAAQPVLDCLRCGLGMIGVTARVQAQFQVRVGIHVGPVVCGVLGRRSYGFDLWGDTVNLAARVEKRGQPGSVVLTGPALAQVAHLCRCRPLGRVPIEGKASSVEIYRFVEWVTDDPPVPPPGRRSRRREHR
ncbi:MAG TPA: adenylate/guanylate cyclase domain-containing protein, partial [Candidatus Nitrosotenuis sp.]|nr:adenylate/guanylate cyclase domain-containing protein [Candidatus Nitrosotenuis sp.]